MYSQMSLLDSDHMIQFYCIANKTTISRIWIKILKFMLKNKFLAGVHYQYILLPLVLHIKQVTVSALLVTCTGNSVVTGEFLAQRTVTRSFDVFFDLQLTNCWVNNGEAGDLRRHRAHYDVIVMIIRES